MLSVRVQDDAIRIGPHFRVSFQRTLRIPDDGGLYGPVKEQGLLASGVRERAPRGRRERQ